MLLILAVPLRTEEEPKGTLFIIGGGRRPREMMKEFIALAGGDYAVIAVFPMASGAADTTGANQVRDFQRLGAASSFSLNITRDQANSDSALALLRDVTGVFFSGGDQSRLTAALKGTRTEERLHDIYAGGGVIGGTSAGAAVMSELMITGTELIDKDTVNSFQSIKRNNIETTPGFGFIRTAIVDQHFIRRKRHNRLLSLVLEHPALLGIGVDESTAIIIRQGRRFDVIGESAVVVFDASRATGSTVNRRGILSGHGMGLDILTAGDGYDMIRHTVIPKDLQK